MNWLVLVVGCVIILYLFVCGVVSCVSVVCIGGCV